MDFYVDHLFRYPDDLRNIVQQCAKLKGASLTDDHLKLFELFLNAEDLDGVEEVRRSERLSGAAGHRS